MSSYRAYLADLERHRLTLADLERRRLALSDTRTDMEAERMEASEFGFDHHYDQGLGNPSVDMDIDMNTGRQANPRTPSRTPRPYRGPPLPPALRVEPPLLDLGQPVDPIDEEQTPRPRPIIPRLSSPQGLKVYRNMENIAFAFGIEHVIVHKGHLLPAAVAALRILCENDVPFGLFTNDAGFRDDDQAEQVVALLAAVGITISRQAIISYSCPFRRIARNPSYAGKDVLIVSGCNDLHIRDLAERAGFRAANLWTPTMLRQPILDPPIAAIMVWSQPNDWDLALEVICRVISRRRRNIKVFVCNEDFNRATGNKYPSTDYWTFYHLVSGRPEWSDDDREWLDKILLAPWVNNLSNDVFVSFEEMVAHMFGKKDINELQMNKMYFVTENYQRDIRQLIRHGDGTVPPRPSWEIVPIANIGQEPNWWVHPDAHLDYIIDQRGVRKSKYVIDYQPERQFEDVHSAVTSLLKEHSTPPLMGLGV